jgi:hypothetical protein
MDEDKRSSVSQATTLEEIGEFWDTHDFTAYDTDAPDASFTFRRTIAIEMELFESLEEQAQLRGVNVETLINLWLQQRLNEEKERNAA